MIKKLISCVIVSVLSTFAGNVLGQEPGPSYEERAGAQFRDQRSMLKNPVQPVHEPQFDYGYLKKLERRKKTGLTIMLAGPPIFVVLGILSYNGFMGGAGRATEKCEREDVDGEGWCGMAGLGHGFLGIMFLSGGITFATEAFIGGAILAVKSRNKARKIRAQLYVNNQRYRTNGVQRNNRVVGLSFTF